MQNQNGATAKERELVQEMYGGELYEYYPLGKYVVAAPGICGGRPTFKYTRIEPGIILAQLSLGRTIDELVQAYALSNLSAEAIQEAILLASYALAQSFTAQELNPV
ncbi:MAG: DUF433 domain-containing protein [Caldilineaceae bacterium]